MKSKLRAFADLAFNFDMPAMCLDNAARDGKPKPRAARAAVA